MNASADSEKRLRAVIEPVLAEHDCELDSLTVIAAGRRSVVRVTVDADDGVDLDAVARVSRAVSAALDAENAAFSGPYSLEVSSPGVDRPLTAPRHWRRARGRLVEVTVDGAARTARIVDTTEHGVTLRPAAGTSADDEFAGWEHLGTGRIQVEFNRPAEWEQAADDRSADSADAESDPTPKGD